MLVYGLHIIILYPILHFGPARRKIENASFSFERIPIQDTVYAFSILITTTIILLCIALVKVYSEIQSWMIAYIVWSLYVIIYLFNRAFTVYVLWSDKEKVCCIKTANAKASNVKNTNLMIKYVVGVVIENQAENDYTRLLAVVGGLFPALCAGVIANFILEERFILKCSTDIVSDMCNGNICCNVVSSHDLANFYDFIGNIASKLVASFGIVRIIGWLFCKGHPDLRDIAQKMKRT